MTSSRPRIAFFLPNLEGGGAERSIAALANRLSALGLHVDLVLGHATGPCLAEVSPAVRILNLAEQGTVGSFGIVVRLRKYLVDDAPDAILSCLDVPNVQLIVAAWLARFRGTTLIGQRATIAPVYAHLGRLRRALYGWAIRAAYPRADVVICNSHAAADEVRALPGVRAERVVTIHNSVDGERIERLAQESLQDAWFVKSSAPLIVSVGSLTYLKDRATLIRAFALVKSTRDVRLAIVGAHYEPQERERIEQLIAELDLHEQVHLAGFDANPYRWMRRASVLVSSSLTEGCPNQLLEGLALGLRIVASDCPGDSGELLQQGKWGRLVPVGDPERMAEAMLAALDDPAPPDGRIRAADFAPAAVATQYLRVLLPGTDTFFISEEARMAR